MSANLNNTCQAVILAGGKGTRLKSVTYKIPKVMVDINGTPFLLYLLKLLKQKGILRILLLVSYLGEQIENYFGNGGKFGLDITYSYENPPRGTGGALKNAEKLIKSEFLLINGDTYLDFDYESLKSNFRNLGCKGLIYVYVDKDKKLKPNLLLAKNNRIVKYNKENSKGLIGVDAGVGIFKKEILKLIPHNMCVSFENLIYKKLIYEKGLYGLPTENKFLDIGSFKILHYARRRLK